MSQEFHKGDHVRIADDLGPMMRHFTSGVEAIVIGSYDDQFGHGDTDSYTLHLKGRGQCSWYYGNQLTLIARAQHGLLAQWEAEEAAEDKLHSDLDWIFANGSDVLVRTHGATAEALGKCIGVDNLWGSHGEGLAYQENALRVLHLARPFLEARDKEGWLAFCKTCHLATVDYDFHKELR